MQVAQSLSAAECVTLWARRLWADQYIMAEGQPYEDAERRKLR